MIVTDKLSTSIFGISVLRLESWKAPCPFKLGGGLDNHFLLAAFSTDFSDALAASWRFLVKTSQ